jgi:hypothetical protein
MLLVAANVPLPQSFAEWPDRGGGMCLFLTFMFRDSQNQFSLTSS